MINEKKKKIRGLGVFVINEEKKKMIKGEKKKKKNFRGPVVFATNAKKKKNKPTGLVLFVINEKKTKKKNLEGGSSL